MSRKQKHEKVFCDTCEEWVTAVEVAWYSEILKEWTTRRICDECGCLLEIVVDEGEAETFGELPF